MKDDRADEETYVTEEDIAAGRLDVDRHSG